MGTSPGWSYAYVPTPAQWNFAFSSKQDELGFTPVNRAGDTMSGPLITTASTAAGAGFAISVGVAPNNPQDGDIWFTSTGIFARVNGTTIGPISTGTVIGPSSSVVDNIAVFSTTNGRGIADSGLAVDDVMTITTGVYRIPSFREADLAVIPAEVDRVYVEAYDPTPGDLSTLIGGAFYKVVDTEPSYDLKFQNDGRWWAVDELAVTPYMQGAIGDGSEDDTVAVQKVVTWADVTGGEVAWPDADFLTTESIANFHSVKHSGPGRVLRGSNVWHVTNERADTNVIYLDPAGDNTNDGLGDGEPKATLQSALNDIAFYGPVLRGKWIVQSADGTYTDASAVVATIPFGLSSELLIEIKGPDVGGHPNVPTAIFDGTAATTIGIRGVSGAKFKVKDVAFVNWTRTQLAAVEDTILVTDNVHFDFAGANGIDAQRRCSLYVSGGIFDMGAGAGSNACIQELFNVYHAIGYGMDETNGNPIAGDMPILRGSGTGRGITVREGCTGHVNADIDDFFIGLEIGANARAHVDSTAIFSNNETAIWEAPGGDLQDDPGINYNDGTADANTRNIVRRESSTASPRYAKAISTITADRSIVPGTVANSSGVETFLASFTLNAGEWKGPPSSNYVGKAVFIRAAGSVSGTGADKFLRFRIGTTNLDASGTSVASITIPGSFTGQWIAEFYMYARGAASQRVELETRLNGVSGGVAFGNATVDMSGADTQYLKLTGLVTSPGDSITLSSSFTADVQG
ncbi:MULTISPECIES: hypothetical protein [unclassified Shinella]|uniref:hypothetical protein n=1 Tax=unclassified Shinella TaxID=2643062 RepID=UPI00225DA525|nr:MULTISPECIES: hypothetical protein [unclassified Shinella]MCO5137426.1 hypothetical protein [Shinella sp.]MDC7257396.1 hypothetical protein [Shinella sp. YE25]CAI0340289.1 hypothetical protein SHINE37_44157 [Rhizobiaceae bacterium]CAK7258661.1 protein of unknown function [Shinella sp. WSC3-e]